MTSPIPELEEGSHVLGAESKEANKSSRSCFSLLPILPGSFVSFRVYGIPWEKALWHRDSPVRNPVVCANPVCPPRHTTFPSKSLLWMPTLPDVGSESASQQHL